MRAAFRRRGKRSGISNLIGAIFFVLIVALVLSTLAFTFGSFSNFASEVHSSNQQAVQQSNSKLAIAGLTFGGEQGNPSAATPVSVPLGTALQEPLLPVSNMNFSQGIQGWYIAQSYPALADSATVSNALDSNGSYYIEQTALNAQQSSDSETFDLSVTNTSPSANATQITTVTLLVDGYFNATAVTAVPPEVCGTSTPIAGWASMVTGNNVTWSTPPLNAIVSGSCVTFSWMTDVSPLIGTYYHTVALDWCHAFAGPTIDSGIATVETVVASPLPFPNPSAPDIALTPRTAGITPGGLIAGYDSNAVSATASSGPGAVYVSFSPTFSGQQLPPGQQLTGDVALSTSFSLTQSQACDLAFMSVGPPCGAQACPGCEMIASVSSSLDASETVPNPLIFYHLVLVNPAGDAFVINQGGSDPTLVNHFGPTGWKEQNLAFTPVALFPNFWTAGTYTFELVVNMTVPGGQPAQVAMHFDDIGLSLPLRSPASTLASAVGESQVSLELGSPGTTTAATSVLLTDSAADWLPGQWAGDRLVYTKGPAAGESEVVISNTATTVTTLAFATAPTVTGGDDFVIQAKGSVQNLNLRLSLAPFSSNPSGAAPALVDTVTYVFIADQAISIHNELLSPTWVEVDSLTFNNTVSVSLNFPLSEAAFFVGANGSVILKVVTISLGSGADCSLPSSCDILVSPSVTVGTTDTGLMAFTLAYPQGSTGVQLSSLYVSGPNGTLPLSNAPTAGVERYALDQYMTAGQTIVVPVLLDVATPATYFSWIPGQVYQVTVVTAQGVSYSASFTAPS